MSLNFLNVNDKMTLSNKNNFSRIFLNVYIIGFYFTHFIVYLTINEMIYLFLNLGKFGC